MNLAVYLLGLLGKDALPPLSGSTQYYHCYFEMTVPTTCFEPFIREILYKRKAQLALKNLKNQFGDQREDSLTS